MLMIVTYRSVNWPVKMLPRAWMRTFRQPMRACKLARDLVVSRTAPNDPRDGEDDSTWIFFVLTVRMLSVQVNPPAPQSEALRITPEDSTVLQSVFPPASDRPCRRTVSSPGREESQWRPAFSWDWCGRRGPPD